MDKYYVLMTNEFGRAVFANTRLEANTIVTYCEILVLSPMDTPIVNMTDLKWYTFTFSGNQDCLVLGDGEIFNHSDTPNTSYELVNINGRKMMCFTTLRTVEKDEQLFIDYNSDIETKVDVMSKYTTNLI